MSELFLLRKRGLYYCPDGQGYTCYVSDAGLYSEEEALDRCQNPSVEPIPVSMQRQHFVDEIEQLEKSLAFMKVRLFELDNLVSDNTPPNAENGQ